VLTGYFRLRIRCRLNFFIRIAGLDGCPAASLSTASGKLILQHLHLSVPAPLGFTLVKKRPLDDKANDFKYQLYRVSNSAHVVRPRISISISCELVGMQDSALTTAVTSMADVANFVLDPTSNIDVTLLCVGSISHFRQVRRCSVVRA